MEPEQLLVMRGVASATALAHGTNGPGRIVFVHKLCLYVL